MLKWTRVKSAKKGYPRPSSARGLALLALFAALSGCVRTAGPEAEVALEPSALKTLTVAVAASADDAENRQNGSMSLTGFDLELGEKAGKPQHVGLRFNGVRLPQGAEITRAYVQFTADEVQRGATRVTIRAQASDHAPAFRSTRHNVAYRAKTRQRVVWRPAPWARVGDAGAAQRTPDLAGVLQEVVNRPGWKPGGSVALTFGGDYGLRVAQAFDRSRSAAPRLVVEYEDGVKSVEQRGVAVILDTDLGIDVDDAGALAVLHALADRGEARILATVANVNDPYAAAALDTINTYYGRPDIPVGRNARAQYAVATPYWRSPAPRFVQSLAERFPHDTGASPPSAVSVYRRVLASQPDGSVTIISVGFMQNLADLLASKGDRYSTLDGAALVKRKVKVLVAMAGSYPGSHRDLYLQGGREMDPSPAIKVLTAWPTTTVFTPGNVCGGFVTGHTLAQRTPVSNPVRAAYTLFFGKEGVGRSSWDLCTVLYAVRGLSYPGDGSYFGLSSKETLHLSAEGVSEWRTPNDGRHKRLTRLMETAALQSKLEALMTTPPGRR